MLRCHRLQLRSLRREHAELGLRLEAVEREREQLYDSFEYSVRAVQRRAELRNMALERRLEGMGEQFERKTTQFNEVAISSGPANGRASCGMAS